MSSAFKDEERKGGYRLQVRGEVDHDAGGRNDTARRGNFETPGFPFYGAPFAS